MITIYHNTRCSKSNEALNVLDRQGVPYKVHYYMEKPLSVKKLQTLLKKLKMQPSQLLRRNEPLFNELNSKNRTEEEWLQLMAEHPQLIERPIVVNDRKAVIARPADRILEII